MKKIILILSLFTLNIQLATFNFQLSTFNFQLSTCTAQTPQVKKSTQAVFSLNTFRADGTLIGTSHGIFTSTTGDAISEWKPFVGASKAVVVDASGKKYDVEGLYGADDIYNVCKFKVKGTTPAAAVATTSSAAKAQLWLAGYNVKSPRLLHATVQAVETFQKADDATKTSYPFYILSFTCPDDVSYCPLFNEQGEAVALLTTTEKSGKEHAVSALYPSTFRFQHLGNTTINSSNIPMVLPTDYKEASITLLLAGQQRKNESYKAVIDAFIAKFPDKAEGHQALAQYALAQQDFATSAAAMEKAIAVADDKAEAHYAYSQLILSKETNLPDQPFAQWSLDKALAEAQAAYQVDPAAAYKMQQARILFVQQKYEEAYTIFMDLQKTEVAGPETMFSAVQCKQAMKAPVEEVITLMDSTIAVCPHPLTYQSAPYIYMRGAIYQNAGQYRKAMIDYTQYEKLMVGNQLRDDFYYNRSNCEREARAYQQSLDDINKAIELNPNEPAYYCALGSLQLQLKQYSEAISSANKAIIIDSRYADAYAILGSAQCALGKKHEGLLNLEQAKDLGYTNADALISKFK